MGKRSTFNRHPQDLYDTPRKAVEPLFPFIKKTVYYEPCVGRKSLVNHLTGAPAFCMGYSDIELDARTYQYPNLDRFVYFITNPPWDREILHPIILNLSSQRPTWLLIDADWMHTIQAKDIIKRCQKIVSVGRVKWIENSKYTGKDNCCWYLFNDREDNVTQFIGRGSNG